MFKLEFDAANKPLAAALGAALVSYGGGVLPSTVGATVTIEAAKETVKSDSKADLDEYNEDTNVVKLSDSTAGQSESPSATDSAATNQTPNVEQGAGDAAGAELDKNGVAKNTAFCQNAAKPFYASGKYAGQWKRIAKVSQEDYDAWYEPAKAAAVANHPVNAKTEESYDTSNAFKQNTPAADVPACPTAIGPFIGWLSKKQSAELLTQDDITEAYKMMGLTQADITPNNPNAQDNIAALHAILSEKAGA